MNEATPTRSLGGTTGVIAPSASAFASTPAAPRRSPVKLLLELQLPDADLVEQAERIAHPQHLGQGGKVIRIWIIPGASLNPRDRGLRNSGNEGEGKLAKALG